MLTKLWDHVYAIATQATKDRKTRATKETLKEAQRIANLVRRDVERAYDPPPPPGATPGIHIRLPFAEYTVVDAIAELSEERELDAIFIHAAWHIKVRF